MSVKMRFFTPNETLVLKDLVRAYGEVSANVTAGVIFTQSEIAVFKAMKENKEKKCTSEIATDTGISNTTAKKALEGLQAKDYVKTETVGKRILWWQSR